MRMRICFEKTGDMLYISLLDLQSFLQRALRRAQIPVSFSLGFNPHPKIEYAPAVGLFVPSKGEYADITLQQDMTPEEFKTRLQAQFPKDLHLITVQALEEDAKPLAKAIKGAWFIFETQANGLTQEQLCSCLENKELPIQKKNKKGAMVTKNMADYILQSKVQSNGDGHFTLAVLFSQEPNRIINPQLLIEALNALLDGQVELKSLRKEETLFF